MESNVNKKPKFYLVLRIIGFSVLAIGLILLILGIVLSEPGKYGADKIGFIIPGVMLTMLSIMPIFISFTPEIQRISIARQRYIQEETKEDLKSIAENIADIRSGAVKKTAKSIKEGLKDSKFCKYCGAEIDADSLYCNKCGAKQ